MLLMLALAVPGGALAQTGKALSAHDAVLAYEAAKVSRAAVRDQLDLCADDADKLAQVFVRLRPGEDAGAGEWRDWGELYRRVGEELMGCLRAFTKQLLLHNRDLALLRERAPLLREPKRISVSPRLASEINAYVGGLEAELEAYARRAGDMARDAEEASAGVAALLREAGVPAGPVPSGFASAL